MSTRLDDVGRGRMDARVNIWYAFGLVLYGAVYLVKTTCFAQMPNRHEEKFAVTLVPNCHKMMFFWSPLGSFALQGHQEWSKGIFYLVSRSQTTNFKM
jgi:hypothetical protein